MSSTGTSGGDYSVVIPTKDRHSEALRAATHLLDQEHRPRRVVIVDSSSERLDGGRLHERFEALGIELAIAHCPPSTSAQRNFGIDQVTTPLVLLMDDDMELPPDYVRTLVERWAARGFDAVGGAVGAMDGAFAQPRRIDRIFRLVFMLHVFDPAARTLSFRASQKLRFTRPEDEVFVPATSTAAVLYRTDLARRHRFDERFDGYVLGEDLDMSARLARERPILYVPAVSSFHRGGPAELRSRERWYHRGRHEAYFRLRRLEPGSRAAASFALSVLGESIGAAAESIRERDAHHLAAFSVGLKETLVDLRDERRARLRLLPVTYYRFNHAYRRARIAAARRSRQVRADPGVRILGYHRITDEADVLATTPGDFRRHLSAALEDGLQPLSLAAALDLLEAPVAGRFFCVTLDDGYRDNRSLALPILAELGVPATIFVPTSVIDRTASFTWYRDPPEALDWDDLRSLLATGLIDIQSHTRTHRSLARLSDRDAVDEIAGSKADLERHLGHRVTSLAFPAGIYRDRTIVLAREAGYRATLTTLSGLNPGGRTLHELRRTMILTGDTVADVRAKLSGLLDEPSNLERLVRARRSRSPRPRAA